MEPSTASHADYPIVENHAVERGQFLPPQKNVPQKVAVLGSELRDDLFPHTDALGKTLPFVVFPFVSLGFSKERSFARQQSRHTTLYSSPPHRKFFWGVRHLGLMRIKIDDEKTWNQPWKISVVFFVNDTILPIPTMMIFPFDPFSNRGNTEWNYQCSSIFLSEHCCYFSYCWRNWHYEYYAHERDRTNSGNWSQKKIGARPEQIQGQFLLEAVLLTGTGGVLGMIFGTLFSLLIATIAWHLEYDWTFSVSPASLGISFFVALFVGIVFGLSPARRASKLKPIKALRYE